MNSAQIQNKQLQIVQNFFNKSVQVISEARLSPEDLKSDEASTAQPNVNKWFNLELKELGFLHDKLRQWRQINLDELPPPLVVECYLNPSKLRPGQTVVYGDTRCSTTKEIVLERWVIEFKPTAKDSSVSPEELPAVYKRAIISIRSLYTAVRLLPTFQLHQKLCRQKLISVPLKLGIRIHNGALPISSRGRIGLSMSIAEKRSKLEQFRIQPISMPIGQLHCSVAYRTDVNFGVEDIEKVMAQKFMELDAAQVGGSAGGDTGGINIDGGPSGSITGHGSSPSISAGGHATLGPRPILNFTRPFKNLDAPSGNTPTSVNSAVQIPQSIAGSASSVTSTNSRFSSSFASQRAHGMLPPRSFSNEGGHPRPGSLTSQGSSDSYHNSPGLEPDTGLYMAQSDIGEFVKFVDETRKRGSDRIRQQPNSSSDVDSTLSRYQNMRNSYLQLSDSIMQGSQHQETVRPERRRSSGPRSRLGFYTEEDNDEDDDGDLLFALSDMHT